MLPLLIARPFGDRLFLTVMPLLLLKRPRPRTGRCRRKRQALCFGWLAASTATQHAALFYSSACGGFSVLAAAAWSGGRSSSSRRSQSSTTTTKQHNNRPPTAATVRYRARVAYDGRRYQGFQLQFGTRRRTVQAELERVLHARLLGEMDATQKERTIKVVAAGRTDAGVHARGQAIHFDVPVQLRGDADDDCDCDEDATTAPSHQTRLDSDDDAKRVEFQLNRMLPPDIRIWNLERAPPFVIKKVPIDKFRQQQARGVDGQEEEEEEEPPSSATLLQEGTATNTNTTTTTTTTTVKYRWNVLYDSTRKLYSYRVALGPVMPPTERHHRWHCPPFGNSNNALDRRLDSMIDPSRLRRLLQSYVGTHDFRAFAGSVERLEKSLGSPVNTVRTVHSVDLVAEDTEWGGFYRIDVCLRGALYKQVRNMVGTALDVAAGGGGRRMTEADLEALLRTNDNNSGSIKRRQDNKCRPAPPEGLTLEHVYFDNDPTGF